MYDIFDCAQKEKEKKKAKSKKQKAKEPKWFYMIASVFYRRCECYIM